MMLVLFAGCGSSHHPSDAGAPLDTGPLDAGQDSRAGSVNCAIDPFSCREDCCEGEPEDYCCHYITRDDAGNYYCGDEPACTGDTFCCEIGHVVFGTNCPDVRAAELCHDVNRFCTVMEEPGRTACYDEFREMWQMLTADAGTGG